MHLSIYPYIQYIPETPLLSLLGPHSGAHSGEGEPRWLFPITLPGPHQTLTPNVHVHGLCSLGATLP